MPTEQAAHEGFEVAGWVDRLGGFVARHPRLWQRLGNLETRLVADAIAGIDVDRPIYIAGLARSGSTILLETLARHADVATHRYRDYPPIHTPYLWNRWLDRIPMRRERAAERTHKDGILVTSESPEAFEEVLWMSFFPHAHDASASAVLDRAMRHPEFERFYREHLRKLLAVRGRSRYVAKGNYNATRLAYLQRMFPDARFVIPVREPLWHIASLIKQQRLFERGQTGNPRARRHLARVGHYEFGLDRRPVDTGDREAIDDVLRRWAAGDEVGGWARYWAAIHACLADTLERDAELRAACLVLRYEDLCASPHAALDRLLEHCGLARADGFVETAAAGLHFPGYYRPAFSDEEIETIARLTDATARRFGYASAAERAVP